MAKLHLQNKTIKKGNANMKLIALAVLAGLPLSGVIAVESQTFFSNGFWLDTRPSPEVSYAPLARFSTFPAGLVLILR